MIEPNKKFMNEAIKEAKKATKEYGDYPIGAIIIKDYKIIAKSGNSVVKNNDPISHAEIDVIRKATRKLKTKNLSDCILYVTTEPCAICTTATIWTKIKGIVYGTNKKDFDDFWVKWYKKNKTPKSKWVFHKLSCNDVLSKGTPKRELIGNFMRKECKELFNLYPK
ncbi:nucleoside deaminase [Candidatus Woesearchaeota archaeon]|nr:nucleoside deaminase [Candidatus Woesearchaeota archaeon]